jgi:hypothetical protein
MKHRIALSILFFTLAGFVTCAAEETLVTPAPNRSSQSLAKTPTKSGKHRRHHRGHRKQGGTTQTPSPAQPPKT